MENSRSEEMVLLEGTVSSVVFHNDENGYTVLALDTPDGDEVTVVGCMPGVNEGEGLSVHGRWTYNPTYGEQFKAEVVERRMPVGEKAILEYLSSGAVKGVGKKLARSLVDAFGEDVLDVIENHPEQLTQVKGITAKRARDIQESFFLQMSMRRLLDFLSANELPMRLAMPLYQQFGDAVVSAIRANPYLLAAAPFSVGFPKADQVAQELGIGAEDPIRIEAGLLYALSHNQDNGHVFLPYAKLLSAAASLLHLPEDALTERLDSLTARRQIVREDIAGQDACYLARLYDCETYIAERMRRMAAEEPYPPDDLEKVIADIQREQEISYAPQQAEAVRMAAGRQIMLLTGGPGTGKTTSLRGILALFEHMNLKTALTAPTGRAAKRLGEACDAEASTIHRLLETRYDSAQSGLVFAHNEQEPLDADAVILDEASMVDVILMQALLAALPNGCRLVLVGDPHQLPSVGPGSLLGDLLRSRTLPTMALTEIFRQAEASAIIRGARDVDSGTCPGLANSKESDLFFLRRPDPVSAVETIVELCRTRLPENMGIPPEQIQVLSPSRKGESGTAALNRALQAAVNPPSPDKAELTSGAAVYRAGDRVMQIRNNYDTIWEDEDGTPGMGIFNGDIGHITAVDPRAKTLRVDFDGRKAVYTTETLNELEPAYAITVHKSQGSEYPAVILSVSRTAPMLLTRGILYTAMTRAKRLLILVGDQNVIADMVANNRQQRRYSGLRARLAAQEEG